MYAFPPASWIVPVQNRVHVVNKFIRAGTHMSIELFRKPHEIICREGDREGSEYGND